MKLKTKVTVGDHTKCEAQPKGIQISNTLSHEDFTMAINPCATLGFLNFFFFSSGTRSAVDPLGCSWELARFLLILLNRK